MAPCLLSRTNLLLYTPVDLSHSSHSTTITLVEAVVCVSHKFQAESKSFSIAVEERIYAFSAINPVSTIGSMDTSHKKHADKVFPFPNK